jgi:hypothetical protein
MKAKTISEVEGCRDSRNRKQKLEVIICRTKEDIEQFDKSLGDYHYIGSTRPVGDFLRQVVLLDGQWIALLAWGSAAYRLKDRDNLIGWTATQRAERQKLVVQNRRFLMLTKKGSSPNLASQVLGAAVRKLSGQWLGFFGYKPLLAETFTDIEAYSGTCYKAAGWEPLGITKGFSRHSADFFVPNERPKKLWVKRLHSSALELLRGMELPRECRAGARSNAQGVMPLSESQQESLHELLQKVPDPRARNKTFSIGSVLSIVAMALLSGCRDISQIMRFGMRLKQNQRQRLALPRKRGTNFRRVPGYKVYYNLLSKLDNDAFADVLSEWLRRNEGALPMALALDGKMVRDTIGVVSLVEHSTGRPYAMKTMSMKKGEGERCEMVVASKMIEEINDLTGKVITADALHAQQRTARAIVERGGEYLLQIKDNQATVRANTRRQTEGVSPFLNVWKKDMDATKNAPSG